MDFGIELLSVVIGCGVAAALTRVAIEGLLRITFGRWQ
jgi:hypothetical protein